jgi:Mg-chelatase subunit ChlD
MLSYTAKEISTKKNLGLDLVIIIDVSGSMSGEKI